MENNQAKRASSFFIDGVSAFDKLWDGVAVSDEEKTAEPKESQCPKLLTKQITDYGIEQQIMSPRVTNWASF